MHHLELHYQEGASTVRYLATMLQPICDLLDKGGQGWFAVESLERWDEREGECAPLEPGTGKRVGPTHLSLERVLRACEVNPSDITKAPPRSERAPSLRRALESHFGRVLDGAVILHEIAPLSELVNYNLAIEEFASRLDEGVECLGFHSHPGLSEKVLHAVVAETGPETEIKVQPPKRLLLPISGDAKHLCVKEGVYLVNSSLGKIAISIDKADTFGRDELRMEVMSFEEDSVVTVLEELRTIRERINVYRGQVVSLSCETLGGITVQFAKVSFPEANELILAEGVVELIERQSMGPRVHRDKLIEEGLSTRRGILLHGPPGTGKTLTVRYLLGQFEGHTRILLSGDGLRGIEGAYQMARALSPSVVVLEDVDLVGGERTGNRFAPVLHDLLQAMDGVEQADDIVTILTTNRPDLLEEALAQRPGRVDQAVEIGLPGPNERLRLLRHFSRSFEVKADLADYVRLTEGASGAFIQEFLRRARIHSLEANAAAVSRTHLDAAIEELLDSNDGMTRNIVGFRTSADPGGAALRGSVPGTSLEPVRSHRRPLRDA